MDQERHEIYERIPWETLERQGRDKQWLVMAVAGAVAIGALAFSFVRSQPTATPNTVPVAEASPAPNAITPTITAAVVSTVPAPVAVAQADLYAIDRSSLRASAEAYAEWFSLEFFTYDGSEQSRSLLSSMLPSGISLPEVPAGIQVFVDWVGVVEVEEVGPLAYRVEVVVRSLVAHDDEAFVRQPPRVAAIEVNIGTDGKPSIARPPVLGLAQAVSQSALTLGPLPVDLEAQLEALYGPILGGEQMSDGRWKVVALVADSDGIRRPQTLIGP
jgi:hypothetical protein